MTDLLAPNGKPSNLTPEQYELVRTPAFKEWFGDWENSPESASKVVDSNGEPLVCYHSSNKKFTKFNYEVSYDGAIWFTDNLQKLFNNEAGASGQGVIYKVFLDIKKMGYWDNYDKGISDLLNEKFNGAKLDDDYICFEPNQIKLADGTNTTFDGKNPDIRFEEGGSVLLAPNGKPSNLTAEQYKLVRTPEFKAWFGDWENLILTKINDSAIDEVSLKRLEDRVSKVVDFNGEPLVVYHGSNMGFTEFNSISNKFFFSDNINVANSYRNKYVFKEDNEIGINENEFELFKDDVTINTNSIYEVFLNLRNPKIKNYNKSNWLDTPIERDIDKNKDGFIAKNIIDGDSIVANTYISFEPNQIKLADGTNITFDGNNPDIRFDKGGEIAPNGKQSGLYFTEIYNLVRTKEFKEWFGDWEEAYKTKDYEGVSKIIDENGEPLICVHNTRNEFYEFDEFEIGKNTDAGYYGKGFYFTPNVGQSNYGEIELNCFLSIKNPYYKQESYRNYELNSDELKNQGYDGVVVYPNWIENFNFENGVDDCAEVVAYYSEQIKLGDGRNTTFDNYNSDIRFEEGGEAKRLSKKEKQEIISNKNKIFVDSLPTYKLSSDGNWVNKLDSRTNKYKTYLRFDLFYESILEQKIQMYARENSNKVFEYLDSNGAELLNKSIYGSRYYIYKNNYIRVSNHHNQTQQTNKETGLNKYKPNEHNFYSYEKDGWKEIISKIESLNSNDITFEKGGSVIINPTEIECHKCNWKWEVKDGGDDLFICHKCNYDNTKFYKFEGLKGKKILDTMLYKTGGRTISQTPAPKKDQIKGSDKNKEGSAKDISSAKKIKFSDDVLEKIQNSVDKHNKKHPNKKITLDSAKAVVRRGMGAYSSTHRPTISGGNENSRVAWGLARLNAFVYKIVNGKSKSGKYSQDNDLIEELGYKVQKYSDGGLVGNKFTEIIYRVILSTETTSDIYAQGNDLDEIRSEYNSISAIDFDNPNSNDNTKILESRINQYEFIGDDTLNAEDYIDNLDDTNYWDLVDEESNEIESDSVFAINKSTDEMIDEIREFIKQEYNIGGRYAEKYMTISVEDENENFIADLNIRTADHSQNARNNDYTSYNLSFVIANKNATEGRFIPLGTEYYFDENSEYVKEAIKDIIDETIEYIKEKGNKYADGGDIQAYKDAMSISEFKEGGETKPKKVYVSIKLPHNSKKIAVDETKPFSFNSIYYNYYDEETFEELKNGKLKGLVGVSTSPNNIAEWFIHRDCLIVMDYEDFMAINETETINYYDPYQLMKNNLYLFKRLYANITRYGEQEGSYVFTQTLVKILEKIIREINLEMNLAEGQKSSELYRISRFLSPYETSAFPDWIEKNKIKIESPVDLTNAILDFNKLNENASYIGNGFENPVLTFDELLPIVEKGVTNASSIYDSEQEIVLTNRELNIPKNSQLFFIDESKLDNYTKSNRDEFIEKYKLKELYKVYYVQYKEIEKYRAIWLKKEEEKFNKKLEQGREELELKKDRVLDELLNYFLEKSISYVKNVLEKEILDYYETLNYYDEVAFLTDDNYIEQSLFSIPLVNSIMNTYEFIIKNFWKASIQKKKVENLDLYAFMRYYSDVESEIKKYFENNSDELEKLNNYKNTRGGGSLDAYRFERLLLKTINDYEKLPELIDYNELAKMYLDKMGSEIYRYYDKKDLQLISKYKDGGSVLLAPNGKPSNLTPEQYKLVRTPAFKKWFGDWENSPESASKVVDENGEPLVVYHGNSNVNFNIFVNGELSVRGENSKGWYFTRYKNIAKNYSGINGFVKEVFLKIMNIKIAKSYIEIGTINKEYVKNAVDSGYDGAYFMPDKKSLEIGWLKLYNEEFVAFESNQIKLADGTNTTFDANNPDIRFDEGGKIKGLNLIENNIMNTMNTNINEMDKNSFNTPLLIRLFELMREDVKSDVALHEIVENIMEIRAKGNLTMSDYDSIVGSVILSKNNKEESDKVEQPKMEEGGKVKSIHSQKGDIMVSLDDNWYSDDSSVELVPVSELIKFREYDRKVSPKYNQDNSRDNINHLKFMFQREGVKSPLIIEYSSEDNAVLIIEGNHRLNSAIDLGMEYLPARVVLKKYGKYSPAKIKNAMQVNGIKANSSNYIPSDLKPSQIGIAGAKPIAYAEGGIIEGRLHSECGDDGCGRKFQVGENGHIIEAERDEAVIVADAFNETKEMTIEGTPSEIASALNVIGGGKNFNDGAKIVEGTTQKEVSEIKTQATDTDVDDIIDSGSIIINRRSMADEKSYKVTGSAKQIASAINSINGNGVVIEKGAKIE